MAVPVVLKSGKNYITVNLDKEMDFVSLLQAIVTKFCESERFFRDEPIAIHFEGRKLTEQEQLQIIDAIDCYSSVKIVAIVEDDRIKEFAANERIRRALYPEEMEGIDLEPETVCAYIEGNIDAGKEIQTENTILITGNIEKGALVTAKEHIIVLGGIYGQAIAGSEGNVDCKIIAREFLPENYRIGNIIGSPMKRSIFGGLNKRSKQQVLKCATVVDGAIQIDIY